MESDLFLMLLMRENWGGGVNHLRNMGEPTSPLKTQFSESVTSQMGATTHMVGEVPVLGVWEQQLIWEEPQSCASSQVVEEPRAQFKSDI